MDHLPLLTLVSLLFVIIVGILKPKLNIGILAFAVAMIIGFMVMELKEGEISSLFPSQLFLMLVGVTLFFGIAEQNGSLAKILNVMIRLTKGNTAILPISFFFLTFILSAIGPGNIAATALIAPVAMVVAAKTGVSTLLMAIMVCTGANAGAFSPISPTGIVSTGLITKIGATDHNYPMQIFLAAAGIQSISAAAAYVIFKGYVVSKKNTDITSLIGTEPLALTTSQIATFVAMLILLVSTVFLKTPVVVLAFLLAGFLLMLNWGDSEEAIKRIPWDAILLITGISVLVGIMGKAGGINLAANLIATISSPFTLNAILALITGIISAYSSSSGVVMPTFIPMIPSIMEKVGTTDLLPTIIAVNVGSHMVDVSPLSTLGAICISCVTGSVAKKRLFNQLMIWGIAMAFVGAGLSFVFLDLM